MNFDLYERVLNQIKTHPETWNQIYYHRFCGTAHCFGGWAEILSGNVQSREDLNTKLVATRELGISHSEANYLFSVDRTFSDFEKFLEERRKS